MRLIIFVCFNCKQVSINVISMPYVSNDLLTTEWRCLSYFIQPQPFRVLHYVSYYYMICTMTYMSTFRTVVSATKDTFMYVKRI